MYENNFGKSTQVNTRKERLDTPSHNRKPKDLPIGALKRIMKDTNLTEEDLK